MSKSNLEQIRDRLAEIQEQMEEKRKESDTNREACITMIRFVTDTIDAIAPDQVDAVWYGSYTNSDVVDYPILTIKAYHRATFTTLATWIINAGGQYPAPNITQDDIIKAVLEGLGKIRVN